MAAVPEEEFKYWAFISYSHRDEKEAAWLHRALETYRLPRGVAGAQGRNGSALPARLYPVFRDREELPSSADLGDTIQQALKRSRALVVLCSPRSASSLWVNQEIETFKRLGRENAILSVILDGEPNASLKPELGMPECFPRALQHPLGVDGRLDLSKHAEPISADLRPGKDGRENCFLKIAAGVAGVPFDALRQRDRRRKRAHRLRLAVTLVLLLVLLAAGWKWLESGIREREASAEASTAVALADAAAMDNNPRSQVALLASALRLTPNDPMIRTRLSLALQQINWLRTDAVFTCGPQARVLAFSERDEVLLVRDESGLSAWKWREQRQLAPPIRDESFALSPDGKIAWCENSRQGTLRDVLTGREIAPPVAVNPASLGFSAFDPAGRCLVTFERSGPVIRNARTGAIVAGPLDFPDNADQIAFTPDGSQVILSSFPALRIFETATGRPLTPLRQTGPLHAASANGRYYLAGAALWNWKQDREIKTVAEPGHQIRTAGFSPNSTEFVVSDGTAKAVLWKAEPLADQVATMEEREEIRGAAFAPEGERILFSLERGLQIRHTTPLPKYPVIETGSSFMRSTCFSAGGGLLASVSGSDVIVWNVGPNAAFIEPLEPRAAYVRVQAVAGGRLVAGAQDGTLVIAETRTGRLLGEPVDGAGRWSSIAVNAAGSRGFAVALYESGCLFDPQTGRILAQDLSFSGGVQEVCFSPSGDEIYVLAGSNLEVWSAETGKRVGEPHPLHEENPSALAVDPTDGTIVAGFGNGAVAWFASGQWKEPQHRLAGSDRVDDLFFSADGSTLIIRRGGHFKIIDAAARAERFSCDIEAGTDCATALSADGTILAAAQGAQVYLWDTRRKQRIGNLPTHHSVVTAVAISRDGSRLFAASDQGAIRQWSVADGKRLCWDLVFKGPIPSLSLTEKEDLLLIASEAGRLIIWDTGRLDADGNASAEDRADALRLADCAEAIAGSRWDARTQAFIVPPPLEARTVLAGAAAALGPVRDGETALRNFLRWLTADPATRPISPNRALTLRDLVKNREEDGSPAALREAAFFSIGQPSRP